MHRNRTQLGGDFGSFGFRLNGHVLVAGGGSWPQAPGGLEMAKRKSRPRSVADDEDEKEAVYTPARVRAIGKYLAELGEVFNGLAKSMEDEDVSELTLRPKMFRRGINQILDFSEQISNRKRKAQRLDL